jgi:cell division protein FtsQ
MARKFGPTISQEELYPSSDVLSREKMDDARVLDLDVEQESPFLRGQKRVSVRRGSIPRKTATRLTWAAVAITLLFVSALSVSALYHYGEHSWRFRVESSDDIEITGLQNVSRSQVMEVMGGDIGRNIFFVPLAERKVQLEQIPWVESASVMRFVPNRLKVDLHERTPVAFARVGSKILLVDAAGTLMELSGAGKKRYSFPVILGMNSGEPASTRSARMKIYRDLITQLDSSGARYSHDLSEVDLSDPEDVKVLANSPDGAVLVHLGSSNYLDRYKIYVAHVEEWRQQFDKVQSVDLRYDRQIIVNPDLRGTTKQVPLSAPAAKAAIAAGVKPAALRTHDMIGPRPVASAAPAPEAKAKKPVSKKRPAKLWHRKPKTKEVKAKRDARSAAKTTVSPATSPQNVRTMIDSSKLRKPSPAITKGQENP